jgi:hypothetical protein
MMRVDVDRSDTPAAGLFFRWCYTLPHTTKHKDKNTKMNTTKTVTTNDQHNRPVEITCPADHCLEAVTVGAYGWNMTTHTQGGWVYNWFNGRVSKRTHPLKSIVEASLPSQNTRPISESWWRAAFGHVKATIKTA